MAWHDDNELSHQDAIAIARQIDEPRRVFGTEVREHGRGKASLDQLILVPVNR